MKPKTTPSRIHPSRHAKQLLDDPAFEKWLIDTRRWFHKRPEIGMAETKTTARILGHLQDMGIEAEGFGDMTGVVGFLECGGGSGPCIGFRADIDALPIDELNDARFKSVHAGCMHACGHDLHLTILLGLAKRLIETGLARKLKGAVKFMFQPAEENIGGAKPMIERGVLENPHVDCVLAAHVDPTLLAGKVGIQQTMGFAQSMPFALTITGAGGHGAYPHHTKDPVVAGAHFITALQSIVGRNLDPTDSAVISITSFQSGSNTTNIIPDTAVLKGTARVLTPEIGERVEERINALIKGLSLSFDVKMDLHFFEFTPPTINDASISDFMYKTAVDLLGRENVSHRRPEMGTEDFAYFTQARPSCMIRLGCGFPGSNEPLHSPRFFPDEKALTTGVTLFTEAAKRFLGSRRSPAKIAL
jgi:amidohydrolase